MINPEFGGPEFEKSIIGSVDKQEPNFEKIEAIKSTHEIAGDAAKKFVEIKGLGKKKETPEAS